MPVGPAAQSDPRRALRGWPGAGRTDVAPQEPTGLVAGAIAIIWSALRCQRAGSDTIAERGWRRLPDGEDVTRGWDGWPFLDAVEPGRTNDIVLGEHRGVDLMTLRWWQSDGHSHGQGGRDTSDRYNIVALRTEVTYPHLTVVRGRHKIRADRQHPGVELFTTGDECFDRRWQLLGEPEFGRAILTQEVRDAIDEVEIMVEPLRSVPVDVWQRYGG